jgi:hypothetical protein
MEDFKHQVSKLEDDANTKASVVRASREILPGLADKYGMRPALTAGLQEMVQELIIESPRMKLEELEAVAAQAINKTLEQIGLEYPGFASEYMDSLKQKLTVRIPQL